MIYIENYDPIIHTKINNYEEWLDRFSNELGGKKHKKINETQRKIIHLLNDFGIDRISMARIMGTLEQENLNENTFLNFIENKVSLTIEDCTDQIWRSEDVKNKYEKLINTMFSSIYELYFL